MCTHVLIMTKRGKLSMSDAVQSDIIQQCHEGTSLQTETQQLMLYGRISDTTVLLGGLNKKSASK